MQEQYIIIPSSGLTDALEIELYCQWNIIFELNEQTKEFLYIASQYNYPNNFVKEVYDQINILKAKQWQIISNYDGIHSDGSL